MRSKIILFLFLTFLLYCSKENNATPPESDKKEITDIDGNVYKIVKIGSQWWMAENLKVTRYNNGDPIPNVADSSEWVDLSTGAYCNYNNDENYVNTYGHLYNWYAVNDNRNIAPAGWHVATDSEWQDLVDYLGGAEVAGGKMKETGTAHWDSPNTSATNESGFSALPGGFRSHYGFFGKGYLNFFWSSTEFSSRFAMSRKLYNDESGVNRGTYKRQCGFSVRCVKD